jgi:hypothetical protein
MPKSLLIVFLLALGFCQAHPSGNMLEFENRVFWPYVLDPTDADHHSAVMVWEDGAEVAVFLQSKEVASDFFLSKTKEALYLMERAYRAQQDKFEYRLWKYSAKDSLYIIWPWFQLDLRLSDGSFVVESEQSLVVVAYPKLYRLKSTLSVEPLAWTKEAVKGIRSVKGGNYLLSMENAFSLVNPKGEELRHWSNLIDPTWPQEKSPLGRNTIFDADYRDDTLVFAYWGKQQIIAQHQSTQAVVYQAEGFFNPHWVLIRADSILAFCSEMRFDGRGLKPLLLKFEIEDSTFSNVTLIW